MKGYWLLNFTCNKEAKPKSNERVLKVKSKQWFATMYWMKKSKWSVMYQIMWVRRWVIRDERTLLWTQYSVSRGSEGLAVLLWVTGDVVVTLVLIMKIKEEKNEREDNRNTGFKVDILGSRFDHFMKSLLVFQVLSSRRKFSRWWRNTCTTSLPTTHAATRDAPPRLRLNGLVGTLSRVFFPLQNKPSATKTYNSWIFRRSVGKKKVTLSEGKNGIIRFLLCKLTDEHQKSGSCPVAAALRCLIRLQCLFGKWELTVCANHNLYTIKAVIAMH